MAKRQSHTSGAQITLARLHTQRGAKQEPPLSAAVWHSLGTAIARSSLASRTRATIDLAALGEAQSWPPWSDETGKPPLSDHLVCPEGQRSIATERCALTRGRFRMVGRTSPDKRRQQSA